VRFRCGRQDDELLDGNSGTREPGPTVGRSGRLRLLCGG
jgi:hypothetical protein